MDASRGWRMAWRRLGRTRTHARVPALDCVAARSGAGTVGEYLPGSGGYSLRWAGAGPPRQLRERIKCDQSPVADQLSRRAVEDWRAMALPAAGRTHGPLGRCGDGFGSGP